MTGQSLVIVESSAKARTIQRYLGGKYVIEASSGHVMDLPKKELGVDVDEQFRPKYVVIPGKAKIVSRLKKLAEKADRVFLALDPDREGEAIAWFLADRLGLGSENARRVLFFEITRDAVRRAMESPGHVDMRKVNAQQARRILDRLVGYQISPILWGPFKPGISAGRVQTVALRLICEREGEIEAFESEEYWSITAHLKTAGGEGVQARLVKVAGKAPAIGDQREADRIAAEIGAGPFVIGDIESRARKKNPPPPFITSTLQQEASRGLGFPASRTMSIAQSLYEGVDLEGERRAGLITYMRTDSVRMAASAVEEARAWIGEQHGADYLPDQPRGYKSKRRVQDAHEAIRPTRIRRTPASVAKHLSRDQARLYELIWRRFVACQMNPAVFDVTSVDIPVGAFLLRATGSVLRFPGYMALAGREGTPGNGVDDEERMLPAGLTKGDELALDRMEPKQHFTQPPPRYSEGTLIKELESRDIGRPSTYATIVRTLKTRKYIRIEKKKFIPSFLGRAVNEVLIRSFPVIFEVEFTRRMESELDRVENGEMEWQEVLHDFYGPFRESLDSGEKAGMAILRAYLKKITEPEDWICPRCGRPMTVKWSGDEAFLGCSGYPGCQHTKPLDGGEHAEVDKACPKCGKPLQAKRGRYGPFLACTGYPDCRHTEPVSEEGEGDGAGGDPPVEETCDLCGAGMVLKRGRFGRFLACTRYPDCKGTRSISIGVPCPEEGCGGELVERQGGKGKIFFGCNRYPDCRFTSWNRPRAAECPSCRFGFATVAGKGRPVRYRCLKCGETFAGSEEVPAQRS